ncbi:MAG: methyltransferase domain-containing protein [Cytophagales bacterium]|nr:methyltransferase domain-containing protein [Cytophagales bacterium]
MSNVSQLYDTLFSFESRKRKGVYPIHKSLYLDDRYADLLDWLMDQVKFSPQDRIFDAGCGTGYSLLKLARNVGVSGKGISLSKEEVAFARQQSQQLDLERQIAFEVASFDNPIAEKYDKVLAIESIKHVGDIEVVLDNLTESLETEGTLIIADDFVLEDVNVQLKQHKRFWQVPGFDKRERMVLCLEQKGFSVKQVDLSSYVTKRAKWLLSTLIFLVGLMLFFSPNQHRLKFEIYLGGLILEQLYNLRQVGYFVLIAEK